jgi:hypothetical protein
MCRRSLSVLAILATAGCGSGSDAVSSTAAGGAGGASGNAGGTGGNVNAAEASANGGAGARADAGGCVNKTVFFHMKLSGFGAPNGWCTGAGCNTERVFFTIRAADRTEYEVSACYEPRCATCEMLGCTCSDALVPVPFEGLSEPWSGSLYRPSACGTGGRNCVEDEICAPPGQYTVKMCALVRGTLAASWTCTAIGARCVEVPFEYSLTGPDIVEGTLPDQ